MELQEFIVLIDSILRYLITVTGGREIEAENDISASCMIFPHKSVDVCAFYTLSAHTVQLCKMCTKNVLNSVKNITPHKNIT